MNNVHLAPEDENEDLYAGYDYNDPMLEGLEEDPEFQRIIRTTHGQRPPLPASGLPPGTAMKRLSTKAGYKPLMTGMGRPITGVAPDVGQTRPMTGVTAAGFTSARGQSFDPMSQVPFKAAAPLAEAKLDEGAEGMIKKLEKNVNQLIQESVLAGSVGDHQTALDKAKEAGRKERLLCKQREQTQNTSEINLDLTYCVLFNLANQYLANKMYTEALNTYLLIVKNKLFNNGGRLRVNMGNIYVKQKKYPQAVKMYRMALDQIDDRFKAVRLKILQNIGSVFVCMGQYTDAITSFEVIMGEKPDFKTALNLVLCYFAVNDRDKMKKTFRQMLDISSGAEDEDRYYPAVDGDPHQRLVIEAIKDDTLRAIEQQKKAYAEHCILSTAKLISPAIEGNFAVGFDWCIECVRASHYSELASELEMTKGLTYLKQRDIPKAIETFKDCGKKDSKMAGTAATNLSFIFFLEEDIPQAEKCADSAIAVDRYNPHALVNKGNCLFSGSLYDKAKDFYQEALSVEATCTQALYNLGLVYKKLNCYQEALECFHKLQVILRSSADVIYHIADLYDLLGDHGQSIEWFLQLISLVPTDASIFQRLGEMYDKDKDKSQSFQYYCESFRYCPTNIDVISWLGAYYMESQFCDKAAQYFERAALIQPTEINWQLMVASCHRKAGNYQQAFQYYKLIHKRFPDSVDCLKFLIRLCTDLGLKESQEYSLKLRKVEKAKEAKAQGAKAGPEEREQSGGSGKNSGGPRGRGKTESGDSTRGSATKIKEIDTSYTDPLGDLPERPKTSARQKPTTEDNEFENAELGELLPD